MAELLGPDEPGPVISRPASGRSPFVLVADHAGCAIPRRLGDLGLSDADRCRHIAWDIGIAALADALADRLGAALFSQRYSRLVIDCNRDPGRADAMAEVSDGAAITGNRALGPAAREARRAEIHAPYHAAIGAELARRDAAREETVLVALHSFTPSLGGAPRPWHAGVLYGGGDERFARALLSRLRTAVDAPIGDNQPYAMIGTDFTVPHHCFAAGRGYVELEIRQDLLADAGAVERWSSLLAGVLVATEG